MYQCENCGQNEFFVNLYHAESSVYVNNKGVIKTENTNLGEFKGTLCMFCNHLTEDETLYEMELENN